MIDKNYTYVVVGVSNNEEKYGFKVLRDLKEAGYKVIPINPKGGEILGLKVFSQISEVPEKVDVAIMVVPPTVTEEMLPAIKKVGILKVWLQPGSESQKAIDFCLNNNLECVHHACIMVERNKKKAI